MKPYGANRDDYFNSVVKKIGFEWNRRSRERHCIKVERKAIKSRERREAKKDIAQQSKELEEL